MIQRVCLFCGSRDGKDRRFRRAAHEVGRQLVRAGVDLVYGGAQHGLMGAVADAVLEGKGRVVGVIPRGLARQEFAHPKLTEAHLVDSMHERKATMEALSDAFLALPGGFGTMDELFEALTWSQLGIHRKPAGLLDTAGYYRPILQWIAQGVKQGFIPDELEEALIVESTPAKIVKRLVGQGPSTRPMRWLPPRP